MEFKISKSSSAQVSSINLINEKSDLALFGLNKEEITYLKKRLSKKEYFTHLNRLSKSDFFQFEEGFKDSGNPAFYETLRGIGNKVNGILNTNKYEKIQIVGFDKSSALALAEGIALSNYQFLKYKTGEKEANSLKEISILNKEIKETEFEELNAICEAVFLARDLVNEPQSYLDAPKLASEIRKMGKNAGFKVEVLNKSQIEALKMGGLLAVNMGSQIPPTFSIMEYKSAKARNKKPVVLVGKGVVYDTGGLSLKPTPNSMDTMKCDMAGAAAVSCAMYAIAKAELNVHVIALVPATDNRPGENAYTPGDVIKMYDGQTVEVLNTDAEGRLILGDALAYAKKYKPELVMDFATLTGAAAAAIGSYGIVCMGTASEETKAKLKTAGDNVHERLVEFPFWDDYAKLIKSDIADMKNIGGPVGGAITAGKFLEKFTDYPWMHFDIAGPAFLGSNDSYRGKNGTGVGVRLIFDFIKNYQAENK
jgi:leucyl aminopeptidase